MRIFEIREWPISSLIKGVLLLQDVSSLIVCQVRREPFLCSVDDCLIVIRFLCNLDVTVNFVEKSFKFTPIII